MNNQDKIIKLSKEIGLHVEKDINNARGAHIETLEMLWRNDKDNITSDINNVCLVFENDPEYKALCFHEHAQRILFKGDRLEDKHVMRIRRDLLVRYGIKQTKKEINDCIMMIAADRIHDPIKDYLNSLVWDRKKRVHDLLEDVFQAETTDKSRPLIQRMGHNWLVSCCARVFNPGCKVDTLLVLVSDKGFQKGKAFEALAGGEWFTDNDLDIGSERGLQKIHQSGKWIWEFAEMKAFQGRSAEATKAFITSSKDLYKIPYATHPIEVKRRVVFCASTNNFQFLTDGAERRFYIITLNDHIKLQAIKDNRDQIWAEAVHYYKQGAKWWLEREICKTDTGEIEIDWERENAKYQINYLVEDAWAADVLEYFENHPNQRITTNDLYDWLSIPHVQRKQGYSIRLGQICRSLGYKQNKSRSWVKINK